MNQLQPLQNQVDTLRAQMDKVLKYKSDLEVVLEQSTHSLEQKNRKMALTEEKLRSKEFQYEQLETYLKKEKLSVDDYKKKTVQLEIKLKSLQSGQLKQLQALVNEKNSEIEVLKEMVKASN